jgi:NarL family two-component system response regulator LiaR
MEDKKVELNMNKKLIIYSLLLSVLAIVLKIGEYKLVVIDHSTELYGGFIALVFITIGIWAGRKLARPVESVIAEVPSS